MSIGFLLLAALILGSIIFAAHWSQPDFHGRAPSAFVVAILWILWWSVGFPKVMNAPRNDARQNQQHYNAWHIPISVGPDVLPPPITSQDAKADRSTSQPAVAESAPSTLTPPAADKPPVATKSSSPTDWMNQPPARQGDKYVVAVASGSYSDPSVRQQMLEAKMTAAANRYIDEILLRQGGVSDVIALEPEYLQTFVRARATSPDQDQSFVRLEFDQHFRDEVDHRYKQFLSLDRLKLLGGGAAAAVAVLGGLYCILRFTQPRTRSAATPAQASA